MLSIHVRLLSGRTASVDLHENSFVYDLRRAAEEELGVGIASLSKTEVPSPAGSFYLFLLFIQFSTG